MQHRQSLTGRGHHREAHLVDVREYGKEKSEWNGCSHGLMCREGGEEKEGGEDAGVARARRVPVNASLPGCRVRGHPDPAARSRRARGMEEDVGMEEGEDVMGGGESPSCVLC